MQEFSSADSRHDFKLDGARYYLPALDETTVDTIAEFAEMSKSERPKAMKQFLADHARSYRGTLGRLLTGQKSAHDAVASLSLSQAADLFKGWAGMGRESTSGESSSSPDVP